MKNENIPLNFSSASTTRRFFNGNSCFDILTAHFFINIKKKIFTRYAKYGNKNKKYLNVSENGT
jgi:hypothetical protein